MRNHLGPFRAVWLSVLMMAWCPAAQAVTLFFTEDLSNRVQAIGPITSQVTGADMDLRNTNTVAGLFVNHLNGGTIAADVWAATGADSGEARDEGILLQQSGPTFSEAWSLSSTSALGPVAIGMFNGDDAIPPASGLKKLVVFDRFGKRDDEGTKGSGLGGNLEVLEASGDWNALRVTYEDPVALGLGNPRGDIFAGLFLEFGTVATDGSFTPGMEFKAGDSLVFRQDTDLVLDRAQIGPALSVRVKNAVAVGHPLPLDIVSIEVLVDGIDPSTGAPGPVPLQVFGLTLNTATDSNGDEIAFRGQANVPGATGTGETAVFEFTSLTTTSGESFLEVLVDILGIDGTDAGLEAVILHELNLVGQDFFEAWVQVTGEDGVMTYRNRFESTNGGEFFDVSVGEPGSAFPVTFGMRGDTSFRVLTSVQGQALAVAAPATAAMLLLALPIACARRARRWLSTRRPDAGSLRSRWSRRSAARWVGPLLATLFLAVSGAAQAVVIFAQEPIEVGGTGNISDLTPVVVGPVTITDLSADNFQVPTGSSITQVRWWGVYPLNDVVDDDFRIQFYLNTGADSPFPYPIYSVAPSSVTRVRTTFDNASDWDVYEYTASLPAPFVTTASPTHHLSIANKTSTGGWIWHAADADHVFFRTVEGDPWIQSPGPSNAFRLTEPARLGPVFELFVRDFLDANPPLPPPVEIDVIHPQSAGGGPLGTLSMNMLQAADATNAPVPYTVRNLDLTGPGSAGVAYDTSGPGPGPGPANDETFIEMLLELATSDGSLLDILSIRDFELVGPDFFSAWFEAAGNNGTTTYQALFQATSGEFFDVDIGDPDAQSIPIQFAIRGDPAFSVIISASHVVSAPATALLLVLGLAGLLSRNACRPAMRQRLRERAR